MITEIKENTKVSEVLKQYPDLKPYLFELNAEFKKMDTFPYKLLLNKATAKMICDKINIELSYLDEEFKKFLAWRKDK